VDAFWSMTPREVLLSIRATSEQRLDRYDELVAAAWQGALWGHMKATKMPDLKDVLAKRQRSKPRTLAGEIARWDRWAKLGPSARKDN
jgi:hypothetical protein